MVMGFAGSPELAVERVAAVDVSGLRDELVAGYAEVYADRLGDPFFSVDRFWERVSAYASRSGFSLVLGRVNGVLVGYALGYRLAADSLWWRGLLREDVPASTLVEDGRRTFAVNEIMVRAGWRRRGYASALHAALLRGRSEERATLLVEPGNVAARAAYRSWGWYELGDLRPFDDAPVYRSMVLDLRRGSRDEAEGGG